MNIQNKTWTAPELISGNGGAHAYQGRTVQVSFDKTLAYFFGGTYETAGIVYNMRKIFVLNLKTKSWLPVHMKDNNEYIQSKAYSSSAIIRDQFLVTAFGTSSTWTSNESKDIDIFKLKVNHEPIEKNITSVEVKLLLSLQDDDVASAELTNRMSTTTVILIIFVCFLFLCLISIMISILNRKNIRNNLSNYILGIVWNRRYFIKL